jgi:AcrR family transcriptional regulator
VVGQREQGRRRSSARQRLLDAAARCFYAHGVNGTGIDTITAEAGVAKMSLYNNFDSKDALVLAYLEARHAEWLELYRRRLASADGPRARIAAVFDAYLDHAEAAYEHGFRGCGLLNAAAELPADAPGRAVVRRHKEEVAALVASHVADLTGWPAERVSALADHLAFLLEGATVRAGLEGDSRLLHRARDLALRTVDASVAERDHPGTEQPTDDRKDHA